MPYEKKGTLMNGVIVAEPNAAFLKKWFFLGYQDFEVRCYFHNSLIRVETCALSGLSPSKFRNRLDGI